MANRAVRVLDTSALLALRGNERGADHVEGVLDAAKKGRGRVLLSFMTRMELLYMIERAEGDDIRLDGLGNHGPIAWEIRGLYAPYCSKPASSIDNM